VRVTTKLTEFATKVACGRCGRLGHRAPGCARTARAIDKVGVEVEGWWRDLPAARRVATDLGCSGAHDGSLAIDGSGETNAWEFRTVPGPLSSVRRQVHALYPDKYDATGGMHVHISLLQPTDAALLACHEFFAYAQARFAAWGAREQVNPDSQFWKRLRGENRFCALITDNDLARLTRGDRYRWLNFTSWERHRTIELRLLPLFGSEALAHSAITEWCAMVEDWLAGPALAALAPMRAEVDLTPTAAAPDVWTREIEVPAPDAPDAPVIGEITLYQPPALTEGATRTTRNVAVRHLRSILEAV
jgi:hypothetical protein